MTSVAFPILVDACVLIPIAKADLLLRMAMARQYRLLWSEEILAEVERNLTSQLGIPPEAARRRVTAMRRSFPDALVENYEGLIPAMTNEEKDRHVLAAAVYSNAKLIVTDNVRDFPPLSVHPYDIDNRRHEEAYDDFARVHLFAVRANASAAFRRRTQPTGHRVTSSTFMYSFPERQPARYR